MATPAATWNFRDAHGDDFGRTYFRPIDDDAVSSIGVGTYLGEPTDAADERYETAIASALEAGANVVDTAINYRHQRSERAVGRAIEAADVDREAVFVATKGGLIANIWGNKSPTAPESRPSAAPPLSDLYM